MLSLSHAEVSQEGETEVPQALVCLERPAPAVHERPPGCVAAGSGPDAGVRPSQTRTLATGPLGTGVLGAVLGRKGLVGRGQLPLWSPPS